MAELQNIEAGLVSGGGGPLLLVDDSAAIRKIVSGILASLGFNDVDFASDAKTAFALLRTKAYRAVICDIEMAELDGIQFAALCHEAGISVPFLMITASLDPRNVARARGLVAGYILKPFGPEAIGRKLDSIMRSPERTAVETLVTPAAPRVRTFKSRTN